MGSGGRDASLCKIRQNWSSHLGIGNTSYSVLVVGNVVV